MWWIVVQGPMQNYETLKTFFKGYKNVIWSAWPSDVATLSQEEHVVINELPSDSGIGNLNYQLTTTLGGMKYAKDLGVKNILKIRSDMIVTDLNMFLSQMKEDNLNFLCCHDNSEKPYLIDYVFGGPVQTLIDVIEDCLQNKTLDSLYDTEFPEARITSSLIKKLDHQQLKNLNFFLFNLNPKMDIYWIKNNIYLSNYRTENCYNKHALSPFAK